MTESPILWCPPGERSTALDAVLQVLEGLAEAIRETDARIAQDLTAPLELIMAVDFLPGLQGLVRGAAQIGADLAADREIFLGIINEYRLGASSGGSSEFLTSALKLRGIGNALVSALMVLGDAFEAEAIGMDHALAALCSGRAFIDNDGRVIARAALGSTAEK